MTSFKKFITEKTPEKTPEKTQEKQSPMSESVQDSLQRVVNALIFAGNAAQTAHWNLRSKNFIALHPWYGETYGALFAMADAVAEQIKIADINLMVNVTWGTTHAITDEDYLFNITKSTLEDVKNALDVAANDASLSRPLQNLVDGWTADITKMIWFINASSK